MAKAPTGVRVLVEGMARVRAEFLQSERGYFTALIKPLPEPVASSLEVDARVRRLQELVDRALSLATGLSPDLRTLVSNVDDPLRIAYLLASLIDMKPEDKQRLLEEDNVVVKLDAVASALAREIDVLELKGQIESKAEKEMSDAQRQYMLRQQMKAIQSELGEGDTEIQELRKRIADAHLPEAVAAIATREVDRLERMTAASPEYQMIRTYLDWVLDVPWDKRTRRSARPDRGASRARRGSLRPRQGQGTHCRVPRGAQAQGGHEGADPLLRRCRPASARPRSASPSRDSMNRKFVRISLGGVRDEAEIRGHRRTYIGSMPGRIVQALKSAESSNPVLMLDEIDKISVGIQGDPAAALLEVLDPAQNHTFRDHYLEIPLDLSHVLFIATANQLGTIHPALLDRMELISLSGYSRRGEDSHRADVPRPPAARRARSQARAGRSSTTTRCGG